MTHMRLGRLAAAMVAAAIVALSLSACILGPTADQNLARWLDQRAGVKSTTNSARYPEFQYEGEVRAELDATASPKVLAQLVSDTTKFMIDNKIASVGVTFGIKNVDFGLNGYSDGSGDAGDALGIWQKIRDIRGLLQALVGPTAVQAASLRTDQIDVMHQLEKQTAKSRPDLQLDGYEKPGDLPAVREKQGDTDIPPVSYLRAGDCSPIDGIREIDEQVLADSLDYGTVDLCAGIDVQYTDAYPIGERAVDLRSQLDAAGQSDYPVSIGASQGSAHRQAEVAPGDAAVLAALPTLETSAAPVTYVLATEREDSATDPNDIPTGTRTLTLSTTASSVSDLATLVAQAPAASVAAFSDISLDDGKVAAEGTAAQLAGFITSASTLQSKNSEIQHLKVGATTGELIMLATGSFDSIPNVQAIAQDLYDSSLWRGRAFAILYDNQRADVNDGVTQTLDPSNLGNDDEALQGFLDAWNAVPK